MWDVIVNAYRKFEIGLTKLPVEVWAWMYNDITLYYVDVITNICHECYVGSASPPYQKSPS